MQVHDELILEVAEACLAPVSERVRALMAGVASLAVPLEVEIGTGPDWSRAH